MQTPACSRRSRRVVVAVLGGLLVLAVPGVRAASIHVGPGGNDADAGTAFAPVKSLAKALEMARGRRDVTSVVVAGGRYELEETLVIGEGDSHLTVTAAAGSKPVVSGGKRLTGWRADGSRPGLWRLTLPEVKEGKWYFRQLFLDGQRLQRARTPNEGYFQATGRLGTNAPIALPFKAGDINPAWSTLPDARLVMLMKWTDLQVPIRSVDTEKNVAMLAGGPRAYWMDEADARYWVENVPDALDAPGEWYVDRASGVVSLLAPGRVDPNKALVVAPRLVTLVRVAGDATERKPVKGVTLRGLTWAETDYEVSADGDISPQAAVPVRGAFQAEHAIDCTLEDCTFENLGGYGVELGRGTQRWRVIRCEIRGCGGGGIRLGVPDDRKPDEFTACRDHEIMDCHLHQLGRVFAPAVGLIVFQSGGNRIVHNEINDLYYTAISVGWNWGYQETPCRGNVIEYNHLHDIGQGRLSDMGGVYTLGIQKGTVVRNNLIHDVVSYGYGGWGLYPDEGSTGILLENNVVYRCKSAGFHQHYGRDNIVRNNVFAFNLEHQMMRTRDEDHTSFHFLQNIVYFDSGDLLGSSWKNNRFNLQRNVYFDTRLGADTNRFALAGGTWAQWQARGHDTNSIVADPMFVDAKAFNFALKPESPALKLGFRPIDMSQVGPRKEPAP